LSYGQEAHRRVGTMVALAILVAPVALFGLFHKTRLHYIGIEYTAPNGSKGGLLMQGDKSNYRAILVALQSVTGVPVAVAENDRQYVPVGVTTSIASESNGSSEANTKQAPAPNQPNGTGSVSVNSVPSGADVYADGSFVGNAPANLKLAPGSHVIRIVSSGYKDWTRTIKVMNGSSANLTATLDKTQ
jgi:PEGA domain